MISDFEKKLQVLLDSVLLLIMFACGIIFLIWPIGFIKETWGISSWVEHECTIDSFWFEQIDFKGSHVLKVRYFYRYQDQSYTSEKLAFQEISFMDQGDAGPTVSAMTPGGEHLCFINPDSPSKSVLLKPWKIEIFIHWFGVIMGLCLLIISIIITKNMYLSKS